jgi:hypothetical protein
MQKFFTGGKEMKKWFVVLMITAAALSAFAGGGQQGSGGSGGTAASSSSGDAVAINNTVLAELGLEQVNGMYRFKQTQSITVEVFDRGLDGGRS